MATTTTTTTNTNTTTLASRAAGLLSKTTALDVVTKAIQQAVDARRVHPAMAQDFAQQLGHDLPLKTKDFTRVVGHLLQASEKPLKGVISKRKSEILAILSELVASLTDTPAVALPAWAMPKPKTVKASAEAEAEAASVGALDKANILAEAEANASKAEAGQALKLAQAVALIVSRAAELTEEQRAMLAAVLTSTSAEESAEATEATEAEA